MAEEINKPEFGAIELRIDWHGSAEGVPVRHSNQVMVQIHEKEVLLSFFYFSPPVVMGDATQVARQLENIHTLKPECLSRISLAPHTFKSLLEIMEKKRIELDDEFSKGDQDG